MLPIQHWFWYSGQQKEGNNGMPKTLEWYYKRKIKASTKGIQQLLIKV